MLDQSLPNIGLDLQRIHRVITRGLTVAMEHSQVFAASGFPDETTREGFWKYCQGLEANTHGHHLTEDDLFFPFVQARLPGLELDELRAEHQVMVGILAEMKVARESDSPDDLFRALTRMDALWQTHIAKEEIAFEVTFDLQTLEFICLPADGREKIRVPPKGLTKSALMGELSPLMACAVYQLALPFSPSAWREMMLVNELTGTTL